MKVVHVLKRVELIDNDIKELRKMEKSLQRNKSFTTPIYISIEKQINILLDERVKLFGLQIANPPAYMVEDIEGKAPEEKPAEEKPAFPAKSAPQAKPAPRDKKKPSKARAKKSAGTRAKRKNYEDMDADDVPLMTQDLIDATIRNIEGQAAEDQKDARSDKKTAGGDDSQNSDSVKLLDLALEKGTLDKGDIDKEKKKVKFFRDNFPGGDY
jgi:hypothetical protein